MSNNMSENMSDEKQNIESRHRDGNLNKEHKKAEVTAKIVKKKFNPVIPFQKENLKLLNSHITSKYIKEKEAFYYV